MFSFDVITAEGMSSELRILFLSVVSFCAKNIGKNASSMLRFNIPKVHLRQPRAALVLCMKSALMIFLHFLYAVRRVLTVAEPLVQQTKFHLKALSDGQSPKKV
jgi:hypothetical protein